MCGNVRRDLSLVWLGLPTRSMTEVQCQWTSVEFPKEKVPRVTKEKAKVQKEKVATTRVEKETRPGNGKTATKVLEKERQKAAMRKERVRKKEKEVKVKVRTRKDQAKEARWITQTQENNATCVRSSGMLQPTAGGRLEPWRTQRLQRNRRLLPLEVLVQSVPCQISYLLQTPWFSPLGSQGFLLWVKQETPDVSWWIQEHARVWQSKETFQVQLTALIRPDRCSASKGTHSSAWETVPSCSAWPTQRKHWDDSDRFCRELSFSP